MRPTETNRAWFAGNDPFRTKISRLGRLSRTTRIVLAYRGRVWGRQLCLSPTLTIDVTKGAISSSADIALPPTCTSG